MKKFLLLILPLILLFSCGGTPDKTPDNTPEHRQGQESSEKYYSQDGQFKILFPGEPTVSTEVVQTEAGPVDLTQCMYEKWKSEAYMVSYSDYPKGFMNNEDLIDIMENSKQGILDNLEARIMKEDTISLNDYTGIYFKANGSEMYMHYKMYIRGDRFFQLAVMREGSYPDEAEASTFLDSFEFITSP